MSANAADLSKITPPPVAPSPEPDERTTQETADLAKPTKITPTDRIEGSHQAHLTSLRDWIDCLSPLIEAKETDGKRLQEHNANLRERCARLEEAVSNALASSRLSTVFFSVGTVMLAVPGGLPSQNELRLFDIPFKFVLLGGGLLFALAGILLQVCCGPPKYLRQSDKKNQP